MNRIASRLQKIERQANKIFNPIKWVSVIQYEGESDQDAIRLAGYPAQEENRGILFQHLVVSIDKATGKTLLMKREDSILGRKDRTS